MLLGDHVDILGNIDLNEDVVRIACGEALKDNYHSYIREIGKAAHKRLQAAASRQLKRRSRRQDKTQQQPQAASVGARVAEKVAEYIPGL
ncbi:hypothetical protein SARC_08881 [Sphaeroforma arctica JP610]|uniref:Uncharacterized protein n=1 Tax=Sphaeroforma arctica JP610 TaxID=667725 RepID=A0A0L0FPG0_9EUKA|nr:hypothetical protein SARC_08881 [Sphaeroforma arctica JP610]KNC78692.1 hypothetical protein SARC_08881 [Sphaeroforma arctica JP610]|eukprot:XP_014152594.1 hypothetical protein SARC_08881 [Sphaeroforma arctica JP610]